MSEDQPKIHQLSLNEPSIHVRTPSSDDDEKFYNAPTSSGSSSPGSSSPGLSSAEEAAPKAPDNSHRFPGARSPPVGSSPRSGTPISGPAHLGDPSLQSPPTTASPGARAHLEPNPSSASISSQASHSSQKSQRHNPFSSPSVLELKRFFGKGRTKHDQGVTPAHLSDRKKGGSSFSLFGLGKKSKKNTPVNLSPAASPPKDHHHHHHHNDHNDHHLNDHYNDQNNDQNHLHDHHNSPEHHHHHHHHHHHPHLLHHHHNHDPNKDLKESVEPNHIAPRHLHPENHALDPNLVVHSPDYEADWDPFHVFGLAPNSERLPFLESGITKYGAVSKDMGSGAGGSVRMMKRPSDGKMFAVKEFRPRRHNETVQKYAKHVTSEYALGAALHNKNIIETIDLLKEGDQYFEVMEYGPHDYFELVMSATMTKQQIDSAFKQIVNGVAYLHSMGVAHRDLKLDNCVVTDNGVVKIIDFGSAVIFKYPMSNQIHLARGILGSDPYLAPEVFYKKPYQPQIADIWSCGIIYCCSYLRRFPWKIPQDEDAGFRRFSCNPENVDGQHPHQDNPRNITGPWRLLRLFPDESRDVLERILRIDVRARITMDELVHSYWVEHIVEISVLPTEL